MIRTLAMGTRHTTEDIGGCRTSARRSPGRHIVRALLALLLLSNVSCGDGQNVIVLRMTSWQSPAENALDLPAIREFERIHPGVRVENDPVSNQAEYREKIVTSIVSGSPPDVFLMDNIDVPAFTNEHVVLDLRPFASRVDLDLDLFHPMALEVFSRGDAVYAFPKGFSPVVLYYNRDLFDAAGIAYPEDQWTQDEFRSVAKALTRDIDGDGVIDQWGVAIPRPFYAWQGVIWSAGGDILTVDGRSASGPGALDSKETIAALEFLTSLVTRDSVAPKPEAFRAVTGNETRLFYSGRLGLLASGHWLIPVLRMHASAGRVRFGVVSYPRAPGARAATPVFAAGWAVPRNTPHRKLAVELAATLSGVTAQRERARGGLELAAMTHILNEVAAADSTGIEAAFGRQLQWGRLPWGARIAKYREIEAQLPEILDRVLIAGERVDVVVREIARRLDVVLAR